MGRNDIHDEPTVSGMAVSRHCTDQFGLVIMRCSRDQVSMYMCSRAILIAGAAVGQHL